MINRLKAISQIRPNDIRIELAKERDILQGIRKGKPLAYYIGWTGHGNLGDEILFDAHKALFPRLEFVPYRGRSLANLFGMLAHKPKYVAGFLGGGTLINQSPAWIRKICDVQDRNLPVLCFGTGVTEDKFKLAFEKTNLADWVDTLKTMKFVGIRGPRSQSLLQGANFADAMITGDTALALAPATMKEHTENSIIGFNYGLVKKTQIWGDEDEYTQNIVQIIKMLIADGNEVRLLPVWADDIESNERLAKLVDSPKCTVRLCFDSLENYTRELDQCGLFIGQKLHATIMATMERIPSIMIEYQPKCRDYMASISMEQFVVKTSECTPEIIAEQINALEKSYEEVRRTLDDKVTVYRTNQYKLAKQLEDSLLEARPANGA